MINYDKKYIKIKFTSDDDLPLRKMLQSLELYFMKTTNVSFKFS